MKSTPRELLDAAARTRVPDSLNLYPRFSAQLERRTFIQALRARPVLLILFILLALTLLTGVAYAVGRLAGFIPGFGFIGDASTVYILEEPAQIEQDGIMIRVENAVSAEDKFWISLSLRGRYSTEASLSTGVMITLSDGTQIPYLAGRGDDLHADPRNETYEFPPLPVGTDELTLRYEIFSPDGTVRWSANVPMRLRPIRSEEVIPAPATETAPLRSETQDGLTLVLENVAAASDKTVLQVSLHFDQPGTSLNTAWGVLLTGEDGKVYPLTEVMADSRDQSRIYESLPFRGGETLTLSLSVFPDANNLPMFVDFSADQISFTFNPGPNPRVGQSWALDQQMQVGKYQVHVIGAKQVSATELVFEFAPTEGVTSIMLYSPLATGATNRPPVENANFTASLFFEKIPAQPIPITVTRVGYTAHGQWQIQWQAPAAPENVVVGPTTTPAPTAALFATPTILSTDPLLLEVQTLAQKFDAPFQQGLGWVHIITETETYLRPGQTFPPPYMTTEQWLELDGKGNVIRSLWTDRDQAGNVIQQSVTIGNYFINFTVGDSGYNEYSSYPFSTDLLTQDLVQAAQYQAQVIREEVACGDGTTCLLVTLFDAFEQPSQHPDESQPIIGMGRKTWVNLTTGQQVKVQAFTRLQDGSERVDITERTVTIEKMGQPPEEVLNIINEVVVP